MEVKQFKILILPLRDKLVGYAQKLSENHFDAEDVVQEVMLKLWSLRGHLHEYRSVEALAMKMTRNACMDAWRRKRSGTLQLDRLDVLHHPTVTPDQVLEKKDEMQLMRTIVGMLPPLQQTMIRLKDFEGFETEEIAEVTGCSSEAIRSNLSRARKKVRDLYLQTIQERKKRDRI